MESPLTAPPPALPLLLADRLAQLGLLPEKAPLDSLSGLSKLRVGVLALQGDFHAHVVMLQKYEEVVEACEVRTPEELAPLHGLIIPGGESTTFGILAERFGLLEPLRQFVKKRAVWGTCAGLIMLCDKHAGVTMKEQRFIGGLHAECERNFFGSQVDSFSTTLDVALGKPTPTPMSAVFIRAPAILKMDEGVRELAGVEARRKDTGEAVRISVAVEQGSILASSFHPQISGESAMHAYFLGKVVRAL